MPVTGTDLDIKLSPTSGSSNYTNPKTQGEKYSVPDTHNCVAYMCLQCNKRFGSESRLKKHVYIHHERPEARPFKCKSCGKSYTEAKNLKRHIDFNHKGIALYYCEICWKKFINKNEYVVHMGTHDQTNAKGNSDV